MDSHRRRPRHPQQASIPWILCRSEDPRRRCFLRPLGGVRRRPRRVHARGVPRRVRGAASPGGARRWGPPRRPPPPLPRRPRRWGLRCLVLLSRRRRLGGRRRIRRPQCRPRCSCQASLRQIPRRPRLLNPEARGSARAVFGYLCEEEARAVRWSNGVEEPFMNCNEKEQQQHMMLKRKREDIAGMLDWVREIAENAQDGGVVAAGSMAGHLSMALAVREAVIRKRARRGSMTNGTLIQKIFPKACKCCMSPASFRFGAKAKCTEQLQLMVHHPDSDISKLTTVVENMNGSLMVIGQENNLSVQGEHEHRMHHNCSDGCLFTSQQWLAIPVGPDYQAQVPQWTDELPVNYDDPETLKWLGTKVWPPGNENRKALFCCDPIGKGRDVVCGCNLPGSVECVRFHVAERRLKLKLELGSAFYAWGFDRMGEEIALSWTDEEEAKFKASAQLNAPSSGRNFWNRLHLLFQPKGRKELVSYYFNCFLLRRRCYQNRITPKNIDSDDDEETEFRFLGNCLGHSAAKYHNTKHSVCIQNTHCMNLDE